MMFTTINIRGTKFDVTNDTLEKMAHLRFPNVRRLGKM